jgi:hypothetical protein
MDTTPTRTGKQVALAALNLLFVLLILFGAQALMRGHVKQPKSAFLIKSKISADSNCGPWKTRFATFWNCD